MMKRLSELAEEVVVSSNVFSKITEDNASTFINILLYKGGWGSKLQNRKSEILLYEHLINESRKSMPKKRYRGGSFVEGSEMNGSDHDNMIIYPNVLVTTTLEIEHPSETEVFFMCNEANRRACYVQLLHIPGLQNNQTEDQLHPLKCLKAKEGGDYLLSRTYSEAQYAFVKSRMPKENIKFMRTGPCASLEAGELMIDYVFTLECNAWPPDAKEWKTRERKFQWPDKDLIEAVIDTKCSVVPIGNPGSEESVRKFQWRISFLLGERQLMWSLNQSQYFCFILLKKLKKKFIDPIHKDTISSFILKTTLFWEMEESDLNSWNANAIIEKVNACLQKLCQYVKKKTIPHYFAKKNNLFTGKLEDETQKELIKTIKTITSLSKNLVGCILNDAEAMYYMDTNNVKCLDCKWMEDRAFCRNYFYCNVENALHRCTLSDLECFQKDLRKLRKPYILGVHKQKAKELLSLKFATTLYTILNKKPNTEKEKEKLNEIEEKYKGAHDVDAICGRLHLATFYFKQNCFKKVQTVIKSIYDKNNCLYDGHCSNIRVIILHKDQRSDEQEDIAHDISFYHSDMCAPDVVLYH